jgi:outer membrane protein assembly factor BamB
VDLIKKVSPFYLVLSLLLWLSAALADNPPPQNWPSFRGPNGDGHTTATGLPLTWSEKENVKWKTAIHGKAWSSPVVWGNQVWLTTATEDGQEMYAVCVDKNTGKILLDRKLFENAHTDPIADVNSYGSPSPVIEAGRVFLHFGTYGTACLDTRTFQTLWTRRDLNCRHSVGPGSSPILAGDLLILTLDGTDVQYTVALNKKTGDNVWKTDRATPWSGANGPVPLEMRKSFCTPLLLTLGGKQVLLSPGALAAYAYDPATGKEIWHVRYKDGYSLSSRPVIGHGMAYISTGYDRANLIAVRLDGLGDVTASHIVWSYTRNVPFKPSPILIEDLLYFANDAGVMTCLDAKTGAEVWKERVEAHFSASPLYGEGRIYCFSEEGKVIVLKPGRTFQVMAENHLPGGFMASPAVAGKALYLRTKTHLFCVQK